MRRREPNSRVCGLEHRYWTDKAKEAPYEKPNKRAATLLLDPAELASAQAVAPSWRYTGNLNTPRGQTAGSGVIVCCWRPTTRRPQLLQNGKVL